MKRSTGLILVALAGLLAVAVLGVLWLGVRTSTGMESATATLVAVYFVLSLATALWGLAEVPKRRIGLLLLGSSHLMWFAWPGLQVAFDPDRTWGDVANYPVSGEAALQTAELMLAFLAGNLIGYWVLRTRAPAYEEGPWAHAVPGRALFVLVIAGTAIYFVMGTDVTSTFKGILGSRAAEIKPWAMDGAKTNLHGPLRVLAYAADTTLASLCLWLVHHRRAFSLGVPQTLGLGFLALFFGAILFLDTGTRMYTALILIPVSVSILTRGLSSGRLLGAVAVLGLMASLALASGEIQKAHRTSGDIGSAVQLGEVKFADNDFFSETAIAVDAVPLDFDHLWEFEVAYLVTNVVPRSLWPGKPMMRSVPFFGLIRSGYDEFYSARGGNRAPGIVGQHWLGMGWYGVLLMSLIWGAAFGGFERVFHRARPGSLLAYAAATGFGWLFATGRNISPGFHYYCLVAFVVAGTSWWFGRREREAAPDLVRIPG